MLVYIYHDAPDCRRSKWLGVDMPQRTAFTQQRTTAPWMWVQSPGLPKQGSPSSDVGQAAGRKETWGIMNTLASSRGQSPSTVLLAAQTAQELLTGSVRRLLPAAVSQGSDPAGSLTPKHTGQSQLRDARCLQRMKYVLECKATSQTGERWPREAGGWPSQPR